MKMQFAKLAFALLAMVMSFGVKANVFTQEVYGVAWTYTVTNGMATVGEGVSGKTAIPKDTSDGITIPSSLGGYPVVDIADYAFSGCRHITSVAISDSVANISSTAFHSCDSLQYVYIGKGVEIIAANPFTYCRSLVSFGVHPENRRYSAINGVLLFNLTAPESPNPRYRLVAGVGGDVVIPYGVASIPSYAFRSITNLTSVIVPSSVYRISGADPFAKCNKLESIVFLGDAPEMDGEIYAGNTNCTAYVKRDSTGWGVEIPGTWNGIKIAYLEEDDVIATRCEVTAVAVKPRWPWNGIVDIDYTLAVEPASARAMVSVTGCDTVKNQTILPKAPLEGTEEPVGAGSHRISWDIGAEYPQFHSEAFRVEVTAMPVTNQTQEAGLYMVIDLSGGTNAPAYPVSYLNEVPAGGWTTEHKTTKLVMRRIEPGTFTMGVATTNPVQVTLTKPFYMGVYEVTQKQYELVTGDKPSSYKGDARPVETVSWNTIRGNSTTYNWPSNRTVDAASFMGIIRQKTGLGLDLPTEAQWEYACRAGTTSKYNNGGSTTNDLNVLGRYSGNRNDGKGGYSEHTTVGSYLPNAWGLYDMHGNVWEWCLDWRGNLANGADPVGPESGASRVIRGGSWYNGAGNCPSHGRSSMNPLNDNMCVYHGFRLACSAGQ